MSGSLFTQQYWLDWFELHETAGLESVLQRLIADACALLQADDGTIGLYNEALDCIETAAVYNMPVDARNQSMRRGQGLAGLVLQQDRAIISRYGDLPNFLLEKYRDHRVLGFPIRRHQTLLGVFCLGAAAPREFSASDLQRLEEFAELAGVALSHWRRLHEEQRRRQRFEVAAKVASLIGGGTHLDTILQATADAIHEILGYPNVDIPLIELHDPNVLTVRIRGGHYKKRIQQIDRIPLGQGIMGAAVSTQKIQVVNDVRSDSRYITPPGVIPPLAELCVPMLDNDGVMGVINIEADVPFDELDISSIRLIATQLSLAIRNSRLHDQARSAAILDERQKLARDLHDNVTQILSSISLLSQSIPTAIERDPTEAIRRAKRLQELSQVGFAEMRALLNQLRPQSTLGVTISRSSRILVGLEQLREHALPGALSKLAANLMPDNIQLKTDFACYEPQLLEHEEALYRVCQESMSNTIRHAHATKMQISAGIDQQTVFLRITDNGKGINPQARPGIGLSSMRERIEALGGEFVIRNNSPKGTIIEARIARNDR